MTGDDNHDGDQPETSNPSPPAMKMKHYLSHTDYPIWQVIHNGNGHVSVTTDTNGMIKVLPSKTAEEGLMVLCSKLSNRVLALEQSKTTQDLVIKKLQKKVKRFERKIKARTPRMTLFKIGNFRRKSLDKDNVSKQGRYLKTRPMFEESDFDNINDMVDEDND
nr:hypothetical protein [Tanacetum cinerariifolium]